MQGSEHVERQTRRTEYLTVAGVDLEASIYPGADPSLPTLILLHEGLGCVDMWRDFPDKLVARTGHRALVYSRQGYGRSDPCELPRPLDYMHDEAIDVLPTVVEAAGIGAHIIIGHSDGASIGLIYAGKVAGDELKALISIAPHVFCEDVTVQSIEEARLAYTDGDLRPRLAKYHVSDVDGAFLGWNGAWLDPAFRQWNIEDVLEGIEVPQLILQGQDDQYGTLDQIRAIEKQTSGPVTVRIIEDSGHSPCLDQEQESLDAIVGFLSSIAQ